MDEPWFCSHLHCYCFVISILGKEYSCSFTSETSHCVYGWRYLDTKNYLVLCKTATTKIQFSCILPSPPRMFHYQLMCHAHVALVALVQRWMGLPLWSPLAFKIRENLFLFFCVGQFIAIHSVVSSRPERFKDAWTENRFRKKPIFND